MKKFLAVAAAALFAAAVFAGCSSGKAELALVTDGGTVDDGSVNQGAWSGLVQYAEENGISSKAYEPGEQSTEAYLASIDLAVKNGAEVIACPGATFAQAVTSAQESYPEVKFIAVDCALEAPAQNALGITYAEDQIGFLAGYAAVKEGYRNLGFLGGPLDDAAQKYGYGFIQGAEYAARELSLGSGSVSVRYQYDGGGETASAWYADGVECIFAADTASESAVMQAAETVGSAVIGVDADRSSESETVLTSAVKGFSTPVYDTLADIDSGEFEGGRNVMFDAASNGVGLTIDTAHFKHFTQGDYDAVFTRLQTDADGICSSLVNTATETGRVSDSGIVTTAVVVEEAE